MFSEKQIAALRYLIANADVDSEMAKRILFFLLENSNGLTQEVAVSFFQDKGGYTAEEVGQAGHGIGVMQSANSTTHMNALMQLMGADMDFSIHYGHYDTSIGEFSTNGQFTGGKPLRYTFWLSQSQYGKNTQQLKILATPSKGELAKIRLDKPGLYPILEPA